MPAPSNGLSASSTTNISTKTSSGSGDSTDADVSNNRDADSIVSTEDRTSTVANVQDSDDFSFEEHGGRPGADLPYGINAQELTDGTISIFQQSNISFTPGTSSTIVSDAVPRGDRNLHRFSARSGQKISLSIGAEEDNAVFQVLDPSGIGLTREVTQDAFTLPETGEYTIVVGGTRGNAQYDLSIGIDTSIGNDAPIPEHDDHGGRPSADLPFGPNGQELYDADVPIFHEAYVTFAPGASSTVVSNVVPSRERNVYRIDARSGQQINLSISAIEDNAIFHVLDPSGIDLTGEVAQDTLTLPETGEYIIVVIATRANASYDLEIAIN
ncbi:MAG: PPC domain-containing protein [Cyanobacteria bacterium J06649_4]